MVDATNEQHLRIYAMPSLAILSWEKRASQATCQLSASKSVIGNVLVCSSDCYIHDDRPSVVLEAYHKSRQWRKLHSMSVMETVCTCVLHGQNGNREQQPFERPDRFRENCAEETGTSRTGVPVNQEHELLAKARTRNRLAQRKHRQSMALECRYTSAPLANTLDRTEVFEQCLECSNFGASFQEPRATPDALENRRKSNPTR